MMETVWTFKTKRFKIALEFSEPWDLDLSFDDTGETAAKIESGEWMAFDASVIVYLDGHEVGSDHLGDCIYLSAADFYAAHRDKDPMHRNCTIMREAHGNVGICHYFPDMVREAISEARTTLSHLPTLRKAA